MKERKSKEPYIPLTINEKATHAIILEREKSVNRYVRRYKRLAGSTVSMILRGIYPKSDRRKSKYQVVLRQLAKSGYLVPAGCVEGFPLDLAA